MSDSFDRFGQATVASGRVRTAPRPPAPASASWHSRLLGSHRVEHAGQLGKRRDTPVDGLRIETATSNPPRKHAIPQTPTHAASVSTRPASVGRESADDRHLLLVPHPRGSCSALTHKHAFDDRTEATVPRIAGVPGRGVAPRPQDWPRRSSKLASDISPCGTPTPPSTRWPTSPRRPSHTAGLVGPEHYRVAVTCDHAEDLQYYVLPDDPLAALNVPGEVAGLGPVAR